MRKFIINVNGNSYEVEVEEVNGAPSSAPMQTTAAPVQSAAPAPTPSSAPAGSTNVNAPMPGRIVSVNVKVGDTVNSGDVLCILEAMKMENEITAPKSGKIVAVSATQGAHVESGDPIVAIG